MKYVTPASAEKLTLLVSRPSASSFAASCVSAVSSGLPLYAASSVSKLLPTVSKVATPSAGGCQLYQTECPPGPPWFGSPGSRVAAALLPVTWPLAPLSACGVANASLHVPAISHGTREKLTWSVVACQ